MLRRNLFLLIVMCWFAVALLPVVAQDSAAALDELLAAYVGEDDPAVVVLVLTPDGSWVSTAGLADLEAGTAVKASDHFRIGSITKTFVGVILAQLADEGVLALDDPISQWLPTEIVSQLPYGDEITLKQLATMTSGIFSYTDSDAYSIAVEDDPTHAWTAAETVRFAFGEEPYFAPGEGYYYSNTNFNLLQIVIETATGQSLRAALKERIFDPLEMTDSDLETADRLGVGIIKGYSDLDEDGQLDDITLINDGIGLGDGGIISTAADLAYFASALFGGELLSENAYALLTDGVEAEEGEIYGLGVSLLQEDAGGLLLGHSGATAGFVAEMWYDADSQTVVVVLSNNFDSEVVGPDLVNEVFTLVAEAEEAG